MSEPVLFLLDSSGLIRDFGSNRIVQPPSRLMPIGQILQLLAFARLYLRTASGANMANFRTRHQHYDQPGLQARANPSRPTTAQTCPMT